MSGLIVPQVVYGLSNEELAELVAKALKEIDWAFNGNISDQNISRIAGYIASKTELKHISGIVGMSGYDASNPEAVRFWAGSEIKEDAPYQVLQKGLLLAVGAIIRSVASGYPRLELNGQDGLFAAYHTATDYIAIDPDATGNATLIFDNGLITVLLFASGSTYAINALLGNISINAQSGDLFLKAGGGTNKVKFDSWGDIYSTGNTQTLQQILDSKQGAITSGDVTVSGSGVATLGNNINTTHLANGTVSNTEFQFLDGVTSAIQTQINTKLTAKMVQGFGTTGSEILDGVYYATLTISYSGFSSPPKVHAHNTSVHTAWVSAITPITATSATIYLVSTLAGQVAGKTIEWTAIGP